MLLCCNCSTFFADTIETCDNVAVLLLLLPHLQVLLWQGHRHSSLGAPDNGSTIAQ